jgi:hypothetical protein
MSADGTAEVERPCAERRLKNPTRTLADREPQAQVDLAHVEIAARRVGKTYPLFGDVDDSD